MLTTEPAPSLKHLDDPGRVQMVDLMGRHETSRTAVAAGRVLLGKAAYDLVKAGRIRKGDVLTTAQLAGILGAKHTSQLVPLCHSVSLRGIDLDVELAEDAHAVDIRAFVKAVGPIGVEMEALTAVSVAALTVYDMCKSVAKDATITDVRLLAKTGGQSGDYRREE
ncbi:MAG: cyclic pyranopterin monophosphate synthase MoaC [Bacteroidota bacterium]